MLKLLLRLWWLRTRRNFKKRDVLIALYFLFVYACVWVGFFIGASSEGDAVERLYAPSYVGLFLVLGMLVPDIVLKMTMKTSTTLMDDYLKSRPVSRQAWSRFLLVINVAGLINYVMPVVMLPFTILVLSTGEALWCILAMLLLSYADSIFVICYRRTSDRFLKFSVAAGWMVMFMAASLFVLFSIPLPVWMHYAGLMVFVLAVLTGIMAFLEKEKEKYDEGRRKATRQRSFGKITLFSMQLYGLIRTRRLRSMVLIVSLLLIGDAYFMAWMSTPDDSSVTIYSIIAVVLPSVVLSQWTFGVEANFFQGLVTKPVSVRQLLINCYYFDLLLSLVSALLMTPLAFMAPQFTPMMLVGSMFLSVFINLYNMPTCLFSTRLELFSNSFFNMQGANMKINLYSLSMLIPLVLFTCVWLLWGSMVWSVVCMAVGVISLCLSRRVISNIASRFEARKYARLESFMS